MISVGRCESKKEDLQGLEEEEDGAGGGGNEEEESLTDLDGQVFLSSLPNLF